MKKTGLFSLFAAGALLLVCDSRLSAQNARPEPAEAVVASAVKRAAAEHKAVFIHSTASW